MDPTVPENPEPFRSQTDLDSLRLINLARKFVPDQSGFDDAVLPIEAKTASLIGGNRFGDYIRVKLIGQGGMGEVWKAWDTVLHRWVALKFPTADFILELKGKKPIDAPEEEKEEVQTVIKKGLLNKALGLFRSPG